MLFLYKSNSMKHFLLFCLLSITLFSCCKEDVPRPYQWPEGTGDYAPYTVGSTFTFEMTGVLPAFVDSFTYTVTKDTMINSLKFYKLVSNKPNLAPAYFANYSYGDLTEITYNLDFLGLITIPVVSENTLRANAFLNFTWYENLPIDFFGIPVNVGFAYTIVQKDFTKLILDKSYDNTITAKEVVSINMPPGVPLPPGVPPSFQYDNSYTKGAGLSQRDVSSGTSQKLKHFNIVK
jgi:hypothetical protein